MTKIAGAHAKHAKMCLHMIALYSFSDEEGLLLTVGALSHAILRCKTSHFNACSQMASTNLYQPFFCPSLSLQVVTWRDRWLQSSSSSRSRASF